MNTHSVKMVAGLVVLALIGALQAVHGSVGTTASVWTDTIISILLIIEHSINGNSSNPTS